MDNLRKNFSEIYDQNVSQIYRFIFLKVNSQEIAQDLTSETFLRGWEAFQDQKEIENPRAFLYKVARNLVTDYYREKGRVQIVSSEDMKIVDHRVDLEESAAIMSDMAQVKNALSELNEDYQNAIVWRYIEDLPMSEIAYLLDRTEQATRVLLHRALKSLKEKLES